MRSVLTITCLVLLLLVPVAQAQEPSGDKLLQACGAVVKEQDGLTVSPTESVLSLWCMGYLGGFLDSLSMTAPLITPGRKIVCPPKEGIRSPHAARILVKYLRENPEELHKSGRVSLLIALVKVFPCR